MKKYKCTNCGKQIDPRNYQCQFCNTVQPFEDRAVALGRGLVNIKCNECGCDKSFLSQSDYFDMTYCAKCGKETSYNDDGKIKPPTPTTNSIQCPYCKSFNTKKISGISKAAGIATFGLFALPKASKQWHCNHCKSDF